MGLGAIWLIALIIFIVLEAVTVGLTSIWFASGALAAFGISFLTGSLWIQIAVFLAVSLIALLLVRPLARRYLMPRYEPTNADRIIGAEAVVTEEINNLIGRGLVSVAGTPWTARAEEEDGVIPAGATVRVLRIEGVKVFVTPVAEHAAHQIGGR